jgi:hypothetical protein
MLEIALFLAAIMPWLLLVSVLFLFIGIGKDIMKKKFRWSKWAFIFFAGTILFLLVQIVATYSVTQGIIHDASPNQNNWKTYTNTEGKYTFAYAPQAFALHVNEIHQSGTGNVFLPKNNTIQLVSTQKDPGGYITITHSQGVAAGTINDFITKNYSCVQDQQLGKKAIPRILTIADGTAFIMYDNVACGISNTNMAFYQRNQFFYVINIYTSFGKEFTDSFLKTFTFF